MSVSAHLLMMQSNTALAPDIHDKESLDACIPNISLVERRKRLLIGLIGLAVSLAVLGVMLATGLDRWWRLPLFFLFMGATSGFFQWRDKT